MAYIPYPIVSGMPIPQVNGGTAALNIDLSGVASLLTCTITGTTLISGLNYTAGRTSTLRLMASGATCNLSFAPWRFLNSTAPTSIAANKAAILTVQSFTVADSGVIAAYAVEP